MMLRRDKRWRMRDVPVPVKWWRIAAQVPSARALEAAVAFSASLLSLGLARRVFVNPMTREGQVSGLAQVQQHYFYALLLAGFVLWRISQRGKWRRLEALVPAALSGLASGLVGAGVLVALRGTQLPLNGLVGDAGRIVVWSRSLLEGPAVGPAEYPPLFLHFLARYAQVTHQHVAPAYQQLQIGGCALIGPVAYLAWRSHFRPWGALAVGVVSALTVADPYGPYEAFVFVLLLPVLGRFMRQLDRANRLPLPRALLRGSGWGVVFGLLAATYSGWFWWSAPGAVVLVLGYLRWKSWRAIRAELTLLFGALGGFLATLASVWPRLFAESGVPAPDNYKYFDVFTQPSYIAMWRGDLPGNPGPWPPPGELGGVGVFTILLSIGLGSALALGLRGRHRHVIAVLACCAGGAWFMRFHFAGRFSSTGDIALFPRTTIEIFYCLVLLSLIAMTLGLARGRALLRLLRWRKPGGPHAFASTRRTRPLSALALLATLGFLCASIAGAVADRYMPDSGKSQGRLAWYAQVQRQLDGSCSLYAPENACDRAVRIPPKFLKR